ncbi:DDHD domain-containing protein [Cryptosporidium serpentis]
MGIVSEELRSGNTESKRSEVSIGFSLQDFEDLQTDEEVEVNEFGNFLKSYVSITSVILNTDNYKSSIHHLPSGSNPNYEMYKGECCVTGYKDIESLNVFHKRNITESYTNFKYALVRDDREYNPTSTTSKYEYNISNNIDSDDNVVEELANKQNIDITDENDKFSSKCESSIHLGIGPNLKISKRHLNIALSETNSLNMNSFEGSLNDNKKYRYPFTRVPSTASKTSSATDTMARAYTINQPTNLTLKSNNCDSNELLEKKAPVIEGYGPFVPRKCKRPPHVILLVHGIGSNENTIAKNREEFVYQLESIKAHWFWEVDIDITVDTVDWKSPLVAFQDNMFDKITLQNKRDNRMFLNRAFGDLLYFMVPRYGDFIVAEVAKQLNSKIREYRFRTKEEPNVVLIGHSLGSIIAYELAARQQTRVTRSPIPELEFVVDHLFLWGSPLPALLVMIFPEYLKSGLAFPKGLGPAQQNQNNDTSILNKISNLKVYNIFHPYDPVAYRLEPLLYPGVSPLPEPVILPYWRNLAKRTYHQWDKDMENARKAFYDGISGITSSISNVVLGGILGWGNDSEELKSTLEVNVVSSEQKVKNLYDESVISRFKSQISAGKSLSSIRNCDSIKGVSLNTNRSPIEYTSIEETNENFSMLKQEKIPNCPVRFDYQLQEGITEHYISSLAFLQSHTNYWRSRDAGFFLLWKIMDGFNPLVSSDEYKAAIEQLKQDQAEIDDIPYSSQKSSQSSEDIISE